MRVEADIQTKDKDLHDLAHAHEVGSQAVGYAATREEAMAAFAKSWRRQQTCGNASKCDGHHILTATDVK